MPTYYRFDQEKPRNGEKLHCFKTLQTLKAFIISSNLEKIEEKFNEMKFWKIEGTFVKESEEEVVVRINSVIQIKTTL